MQFSGLSNRSVETSKLKPKLSQYEGVIHNLHFGICLRNRPGKRVGVLSISLRVKSSPTNDIASNFQQYKFPLQSYLIAGRLRDREGRGHLRADREELRRGRPALQVPARRVLRAVVRPLQGPRAGVREGVAGAPRGTDTMTATHLLPTHTNHA